MTEGPAPEGFLLSQLPYSALRLTKREASRNPLGFQSFVPCLSKCCIEEEVTTKAPSVMCQIPVPEIEMKLNGGYEVDASTTSSADMPHCDQIFGYVKQCVPTVLKPMLGMEGKGKSKMLPRHSTSDYDEENQSSKQKEKQTVQGHRSNGGDSTGNDSRIVKSKIKREDHDAFKSSKKSKTDGDIADWHSNVKLARKDGLNTSDNIKSLKQDVKAQGAADILARKRMRSVSEIYASCDQQGKKGRTQLFLPTRN